MGIINLNPRCTRCGITDYGGEAKIKVGDDELSFSLCSYCLPIARDKIFGFIHDTIGAGSIHNPHNYRSENVSQAQHQAPSVPQ